MSNENEVVDSTPVNETAVVAETVVTPTTIVESSTTDVSETVDVTTETIEEKKVDDTTVTPSPSTDSSGVSGTLSDLDPETQAKVQQAFTEHGIDYNSALTGDKNSSTYVDPAKVVKDFDKMSPEVQEKVRIAFNDPKLKAKIANNEIENQLNLEKEMDEIRKNINWDEIEKDADGIPVLTDKDKSRIVAVGAAKKDEIEIIVQSARASVKTARAELDEYNARNKELDTIIDSDSVEPLTGEAKTKDENEKKAAKEEKSKLSDRIKASEDLEKSSIETLGVFQDLARKTVQNLVDDNAFLRALSLVSTKIVMTTFEDAIKNGVCNALYSNEYDTVAKINTPPYEFNDYILSAVNPFIKTGFTFFDALLNTYVTLNKFDIEKEDIRNGNYDSLLKHIDSFNTSLENAIRQPFMVASRYCPGIDSIFTTEFTPFNNAAKEAIGWPKTTNYTNENNDDIHCINNNIKEIEDLINVNYATIRERVGILNINLVKHLQKVSTSKKNTFVKVLSAYIECYYINFISPLFHIISTGKTVKTVKNEKGEDITNTIDLSELEIKRYIYLAFSYIALYESYVKNLTSFQSKLANHSDFEGHKDSINDVLRYINSEFFLSLEILYRYDSYNPSADYTVEKFINDDIYKNLSHEVFVAFKELDVNEARKQFVNTSLKTSNEILLVTRYIIQSILDNNSNIY